jgi:hypothetical protein
LIALVAWLIVHRKKEGIEPAVLANNSDLDDG